MFPGSELSAVGFVWARQPNLEKQSLEKLDFTVFHATKHMWSSKQPARSKIGEPSANGNHPTDIFCFLVFNPWGRSK